MQPLILKQDVNTETDIRTILYVVQFRYPAFSNSSFGNDTYAKPLCFTHFSSEKNVGFRRPYLWNYFCLKSPSLKMICLTKATFYSVVTITDPPWCKSPFKKFSTPTKQLYGASFKSVIISITFPAVHCFRVDKLKSNFTCNPASYRISIYHLDVKGEPTRNRRGYKQMRLTIYILH